MSTQSFWDDRYAQSDRVWSGEPNVVLVREVADLTPGSALDLGCGEGADAIWLAARGWKVTAVDISPVALAKAAQHAGPGIDFQRHDLSESFPEGLFDLVSAQFLYSQGDFPRMAVLRRAARAVAPGGTLLIEGHQDHGPFGTTPGAGFPSTAEVIAGLELAPGEWETLLEEEHDRIQTGPDGRPAHRVDSTIKLRRSAG